MNTSIKVNENIDNLVAQRGMVVSAEVIVDSGVILELGTVLTSFDAGESFEQYGINTWESDATYVTDDLVYFNGNEYKYIGSISSNKPSLDTQNWELVRSVEFNGILLETVSETCETAILVTGKVVKDELIGIDGYNDVEQSLYRNKIVLV